MDHMGSMAGCVGDLAILLQAMAGHDPRDSLCSDRPVPDYLVQMDARRDPPQLARVSGLFDSLAEPPVRDLLHQVCDKLRTAGARITERALPAAFDEVIGRHRIVMAVEAAAYHEERLLQNYDEYGPQIQTLLEEGLACPAIEYARCKEHQALLSRAMVSCYDGVDALIVPATTGPAPDKKTTGDPAFNSPWSYTGLPVVSIPSGWTQDRMPLAIQLVGRPFGEAELFAAAAWCEEVIGLKRAYPPVLDA
jgi:aspartyl-tRNA(Asn)/glutamyl-tRNA(Gln) amidotransferase subunit A